MKVIIGAILGVVIGVLVMLIFTSEKTITKYEKVIERDTVELVIDKEPVIIEKVVPQIIYKSDTIYQTAAFEARIDTVVLRDTIYAAYHFPENYFSLAFKPGRDTVRQVYQFEYEKKETPYLKEALYVGAGLVGGIIIHSLIK